MLFLLMDGFNQNLLTENVSMALRNSQLTMIKKRINPSEVNFNHPFFWAGLILIGHNL